MEGEGGRTGCAGGRPSAFRVCGLALALLLAPGAGVSGREADEPASGAAGTLAAGAAAPAGPPPILVTGRSLPPPFGLETLSASLVTRPRLLSLASGRLEEALRDVPGFKQFRRLDSRAANPSTQGATFRGLGGNASARALVLLDGVPQGDPFAGWIAWSALAPERLARVRVTRGAVAGAAGSGAVAGLIELESASAADRPAGALRALAGSFGDLEASAALIPRLGRGFLALDARLDRGDGYLLLPRAQRGPVDVPARYRVWSASARMVAPLGKTAEAQLLLSAFRDRRLRGFPGADNRVEGADTALRLLIRGAWQLDALVWAQGRDFATVARAANADRTAALTTLDQFRTPASGLGGRLELRPPTAPPLALRAGLDARRAEGETNERFAFAAGRPSGLRVAGGRAETWGAFLEADIRTEAFALAAALRADRWRLAEGRLSERSLATGLPIRELAFPPRAGTELSAHLGAGTQAAPGLALRMAAATAFRLPTLNELYRPFRVGLDATAANPDLLPERAHAAEAGIDWTPRAGLAVSLTGYRQRLERPIANVTLARGPGTFPQVGFVAAGGSFRERRNLSAIRSLGLEAEARARLGAATLSAAWAVTDARVEAEGPAAPLNGRPPAQTPKHQLSATLTLRPAPAEVSLSLRHLSAQAEDDLGERRLPPATTIDASVSVPLGRGLVLLLRGENLLNEEVVAGVSAAGIRDLAQPRTLWAGLGLAF